MDFRFSIPLSERSLHLLQNVMVQSIQAHFIFFNQERQCKCNVTLRPLRVAAVCHGQTVSIMRSECVFVALLIQHAKRMHSIILSSVAFLGIPYFFTLGLSHKRHEFREEKLLNIK